ncbi:DUF6526 family protein [uncultured Flavobacterium sp.]|uniref:DUF6526 family protein n=1 Tax=uncultured Flavobacterium sp. TaxID=165435 RepID=UPI0025DCEF30|nr:DUF6526 family protein [uncultured Flavobacterium sp.]
MEPQSFKNHIRFYIPHHFVFYPVMLILLIISVYFSFSEENLRAVWIFISILNLAITLLSFMLRQHYALTLQDRIVRLELRYRYFTLTNERLELLEKNLSESQLFALRFAPDEELPNLVDKAIAENLSATVIKKSIKNWLADNQRV